jgi:hypothetical protein
MADDFERQLRAVAAQMAAPDFFPVTMPENDLRPDPARLQSDIISLRYRVTAIEKRLKDAGL